MGSEVSYGKEEGCEGSNEGIAAGPRTQPTHLLSIEMLSISSLVVSQTPATTLIIISRGFWAAHTAQEYICSA